MTQKRFTGSEQPSLGNGTMELRQRSDPLADRSVAKVWDQTYVVPSERAGDKTSVGVTRC